ncbi:MAG: hypothetical protein IJA69_02570 [Clostridia bacterium]|nr:hypothetical protein [Clostridia bacterium]
MNKNLLCNILEMPLSEMSIKIFLTEIYENEVNELNIKGQTKLVFGELEDEVLGCVEGNVVKINQDCLNQENFVELVKTIYHELRHFYQDKTKMFGIKKLRLKVPEKYPTNIATYSIFMLDDISSKMFNLFDKSYAIYYTSKNEKDARDYANHKIKQLFVEIFKQAKLPAKQNLKVFAQQVVDIEKRENFAYEGFFEKLGYLDVFDKMFCKNFVYRLTDELKDAVVMLCDPTLSAEKRQVLLNVRNNYSTYVSAILNVYCSNEMKKQIIDAAIFAKDTKALEFLFNAYSVEITEQDFGRFITYCNKNNIDFEQTKTRLDNWDKQDLDAIYDKFCKTSQTQPQNFSQPENQAGL